jgi:hypothetical protein
MNWLPDGELHRWPETQCHTVLLCGCHDNRKRFDGVYMIIIHVYMYNILLYDSEFNVSLW